MKHEINLKYYLLIQKYYILEINNQQVLSLNLSKRLLYLLLKNYFLPAQYNNRTKLQQYIIFMHFDSS